MIAAAFTVAFERPTLSINGVEINLNVVVLGSVVVAAAILLFFVFRRIFRSH